MTVPPKDSDAIMPSAARIVEISKEPVELYKILKFEGMVTSGGEAKAAVATRRVKVNGKVETQKRKKIVAGDSIEFDNETLKIKLAATSDISIESEVEKNENE